jgi:hypothetical protein
MLGAPHEGERETARRKLEALLKRLGKTWNDLPELLRPDYQPGAVDPRDDPPNGTHPFDNPSYTPCSLIAGMIEKYVALEPHQSIAVALWIIHTHVYDRFMMTPRLVLTSPVRGCGKSTLLDVIGRLVARPEKSDNATTATIYHAAHAANTLCLDEADNLDVGATHAMRAVLNAGHRKGGCISRMMAGQPRRFNVFTPVALAAIGSLSLPLMHRSIVIHMVRHDGSRPLLRFDAGNFTDFDTVYSYVRHWVRQAKINTDPDMPPDLRNRQADNWRPLIAIADACGPEWGANAREAAIALSRGHHDEDIAIALLRDIREVFGARKMDRMMSRMIVDDLIARPDAEWSEWRGAQGDQRPHKLTTGALAMLLRPFGIRPRTIWPLRRTAGTKSGKGYFRWQFEPVWRSYCDNPGTAAQPPNIRHLTGGRVA